MGDQQRGSKRSAPGDAHPSTRRRIPYTLRACDACRKRKGKCCGRLPCEYCVNRDQACHYSPTSTEWKSGHASPPYGDLDHDSAPSTQRSSQPYTVESLSTLEDLVANLYRRIDSLAAQVEGNQGTKNVAQPTTPVSSTSETASEPGQRTEGEGRINSGRLITKESPRISRDGAPQAVSAHQDPARRLAQEFGDGNPLGKFCGPTSPDFTFNMAQIRLQQGSSAKPPVINANLASLDEILSEDESPDPLSMEDKTGHTIHPVARADMFRRLLGFKSMFSASETSRLLYEYQEVVGEYYPILDIPMLVKQLNRWYHTQTPQPLQEFSAVDENNLLFTNLAIAIALSSESISKSDSQLSKAGRTIYAGCRDLINAKLVSPMPTIKHVIICLLVGILHFQKEMPRYAWRMCGLAGRTLMELGLLNGKLLRKLASSEPQWAELVNVTTTVMVLDRQWSAATGFTAHFTNAHFDPEVRRSINNPYLVAITSFILMSDKFNEPSNRVANGGSYEDDDEFGIMNYQIEQWRRKVIGSFDFSRVSPGQPASQMPPPWVFLLALRANAVRGLLIRPFFFSHSSMESSCRNVRPGLGIVAEAINLLTALDQNTDVYRRQHPTFQHCLFGSCALLFLIIICVEQNRTSIGNMLPSNYASSVADNFIRAFRLASKYSTCSRASRKLWKRLRTMRSFLIEAGILKITQALDGQGSNSTSGDTRLQATATQQPPVAYQEPVSIDPLTMPAFVDLSHDYLYSAISSTSPDELSNADRPPLDVDWAVSMTEDWPMNSSNGLLWSI